MRRELPGVAQNERFSGAASFSGFSICHVCHIPKNLSSWKHPHPLPATASIPTVPAPWGVQRRHLGDLAPSSRMNRGVGGQKPLAGARPEDGPRGQGPLTAVSGQAPSPAEVHTTGTRSSGYNQHHVQLNAGGTLCRGAGAGRQEAGVPGGPHLQQPPSSTLLGWVRSQRRPTAHEESPV